MRSGGTSNDRLASLDPSGKDAERIRRDVDGVAVLTNSVLGPQANFVGRLAERLVEPRRRMVLGPYVTSDQATLRAFPRSLDGVVGTALYPPAHASDGMRRHVESYARAFPGLQRELAGSELVLAYRNGVDALLQAFERAGGDLSGGRRRLRAELDGLDTVLAGERVRLDRTARR